jgi:hypothetical protein
LGFGAGGFGGAPLSPYFAKSHHCKGDKVVCFVSVLKLLIVKGLGRRSKVDPSHKALWAKLKGRREEHLQSLGVRVREY